MTACFHAINPATGQTIGSPFVASTAVEVTSACARAEAAFDDFRSRPPEERATFLEAVANHIEALGDALVERAMAESGLARERLVGERGRTCAQLCLFARVLREGRWADVTFDAPLPDRQPLPRSDLRRRRIAVGPVAVFGASNFPLAFSTAGGDTASALAAGCPVVMKGHPAHPGTSALVAQAISQAITECGLPDGVFALLQGDSHDLGAMLVRDSRIAAVGFTGSRAGGLALVALANARPQPIPVYAEMSSVNPVILFPAALAARAEALGQGFVASLTLGAGQFCTNPGVVLAVEGADLERFLAAAAQAISIVAPQVMLTAGIRRSFIDGTEALKNHPAVELIAEGAAGCEDARCLPILFATAATDFIAYPELRHEVFGAAGIVVRCASLDEVRTTLIAMEGQLTTTLQIDTADHDAARPFISLLERKAGRILANGWPTGVEVGYAMVHGGPFPATSDARSTSVGTTAIDRFLRPICYQALPDALLPAEVKNSNPFSLPHAMF